MIIHARLTEGWGRSSGTLQIKKPYQLPWAGERV